VPGHIKHLAETFDDEINSSDKACWDFSMYMDFFQGAAEVIKELAVQPDGMTDEEFETYKRHVDLMTDKAGKNSRYRCTNGKVFKSQHDDIMKSGWFMTIDYNSMSQIVLDVAIKIVMGYSDDEICKMKIVAGGDDVLQQFPKGFDKKKYISIAADLGFELSDFEVTKSFDGCEFFSNRFHKRDGVWTFVPERFTKHVEKLRKVKLDDLSGALSSHMMNFAWNTKKFAYFEKMYKVLRKEHPDKFPLSRLVSQRMLQNKLTGCEIAA